jgi:TolB protein
MAADSPSYFHGWSPDNKTLAFVAQRNGSGQYDIYSMPAGGGPEKRLTENIHQDDGPDYSPDGKWIYINSDRSGKEGIWRVSSPGAGPNDGHAQMVVSNSLEDWFPHASPDGKKLVYIAYPARTPTYDSGTVQIEIKLVASTTTRLPPRRRFWSKAQADRAGLTLVRGRRTPCALPRSSTRSYRR